MLQAKEFHGLPLSLFLCNLFSAISWFSYEARFVPLDWVLPLDGALKLNFDGASKGNPGPAGFGYVLRNHSDKVIRAVHGLWVSDSTIVDIMGLREIRRLDVSGCFVEGDSNVVIKWGGGQG